MNSPAMTAEEVARAQLAQLRREHRELDEAVRGHEARGQPGDQLAIRRLKKRKLMLKDEIRLLEDRMTPDIIA